MFSFRSPPWDEVTYWALDLETGGLDPKRLRTIHTRFLSTGQRQRVKLAYSVLGSPAVLFLDEPGSNLDEAGHRAVEAIVSVQRARGSVVLATNDPVELALADETVTL